MAKVNDKAVTNIYETFNYDQFSILPENRGQKENKGIKESKIKTMQRMIDNDTWVHEVARVRVNLNFEIVDGSHTFEVSKRNALPIRYEIMSDDKFNNVTRRDLIGSMHNINAVHTAWTAADLFNAAVQVKAPLALDMKAVIENENNYFLWTDLMALILKDTNFFIGRWKTATMKSFEEKESIDYIRSDEFTWELKHFVKLNTKARIAFKKGMILKAAYDILWHAGEMVDKKLFRKALASVPENLIVSQRTQTDEGCRRMLLQHYNRSQGQSVETGAVLFALNHKNAEEPIIEIS